MIEIKKHSGIYTLKAQQRLNISLEEAWNFFSSPKNLAKITPSFMGFYITSELSDVMNPGQIISYKIALLPGVKSNWVTEITHVEDKQFFVDEQRFGPYAMWHHEHHFQKEGDEVLMVDKISYKLPLGAIGRSMHDIVIKPKLKQVFRYREEILNTMFNQKEN